MLKGFDLVATTGLYHNNYPVTQPKELASNHLIGWVLVLDDEGCAGPIAFTRYIDQAAAQVDRVSQSECPEAAVGWVPGEIDESFDEGSVLGSHYLNLIGVCDE